jgi:hypothetical protein
MKLSQLSLLGAPEHSRPPHALGLGGVTVEILRKEMEMKPENILEYVCCISEDNPP